MSKNLQVTSKKLKIGIRAPKEAFGSQIYIVFVDVTNLTSTPIEKVTVAHQFLPGRLKIRELPPNKELSELQEKKQKIVREMEIQVAKAFENKIMRGQSWIRRIVYLMMKLLRFTEVRPVPGLPIYIPIYKFMPDYTEEALSIKEWEDVERLDKLIISNEPENSEIRLAFSLNKDSLKAVLEKIKKTKTATEQEKANLKDIYTIHPGETISYPFEIFAPWLYHAKTFSLQFKIVYHDPTAKDPPTFSEGRELDFHPSPIAIYIGAVLGALAAFISRVALAGSLLQSIFDPSIFWPNLLGCTILATIFVALTVRTPNSKKVFTTEDFTGGFILGALVGISSHAILDYITKFVPKP